MSTVGEKIRAIRKQRKISQKQLAELSGISQSGISAIEISVANPSVESIRLIADALHVAQSELLEETENAAAVAHDSIVEEITFLIQSLSPEGRKQALSYLRFLSESKDNP